MPSWKLGRKYPPDGSCGEDEGLGCWALMVGEKVNGVEQDESVWARSGIGTGWLFSSFEDRITTYTVQQSLEKRTFLFSSDSVVFVWSSVFLVVIDCVVPGSTYTAEYSCCIVPHRTASY